MSVKSSKRWLLVAGGVVALSVAGIVWQQLRSPFGSEAPFTMIKIWKEPGKPDQDLSDGFLWVHRQCRENLADSDGVSHLIKRGADEITRTDNRVWTFKILANSKWSDDGSPVTAEQFVSAWKLRSGKVATPEFKRIKNISAKDDIVTVELDGEENLNLDLAALTSPWLTPLKPSKWGSWSWQSEISGPCNGPFVPAKQSSHEFALVRNKHWRNYDAALLSSVRVLLQENVGTMEQFSSKADESGRTSIKPLDLFGKGLLSYVGPSSLDLKGSVQRVVYGRAFLDPKAYYMILNPNGMLGGKFIPFAHYALNRGELSGVVNGEQKFFAAHRVIPSSLLAKDATGQPVTMTPMNWESVNKARRVLGIGADTLISDIKPYFKQKLVVVNIADQMARTMAERFVLRIRANYKVDGTVVDAEGGKLPRQWDVAIFSVDLTDGIYGLASNLSKAVSTYVPSRPDLANKIASLARDKNETLLSPKAVSIANQIDQMMPENSVLMPIGQFGYPILVDQDVVDVAISGDVMRDPDVSLARRLVRETKL